MCGITGFLSPAGTWPGDAAEVLAAMTGCMAHRGPDDSGAWLDRFADDGGVALGQRRLAILDLSPLGHQPMFSEDGDLAIVYNGEVYNYRELRAELEPLGHRFRGGSDTEVMLAAISQWGLPGAVSRFVGMFAFALWDRKRRTLSLVRDRLGIKPLYYGFAGPHVVFGSEMKALRAHPRFDPAVSPGALALYFRHNYVPAPHCIHARAAKLPPGCILTLAVRPDGSLAAPLVDPYWSARDVWAVGATDPFPGSDEEAAHELERLLAEAVRLRLIADVPLGALLSGGIDSSLVVALMQAASSRPVKTFTIGFAEKGYNEAEHAQAVARHLGTEHTELYVSPRDLLDVVPRIPRFFDEPFADASQIPTFLVCELARRHVTVALSGDGGDELFAGYSRYFYGRRWADLARAPLRLRALAASTLEAVPPGLLGRRFEFWRKRSNLLRAKDFREFYRGLVSHHPHPASLVPGAGEPPTELAHADPRDAGHSLMRRMQLWDIVSYLPDDILVKGDRASMAVSLEGRVPLLDHRVVAFAARLTDERNVSGGQGKQLLRRVLYRHVPRELIDRPKMGFGVPVVDWLGRELRPYAEELLSEAALARSGLLDAKTVRRLWQDYLAGARPWYSTLWNVLIFQGWWRETMERP